MALLNLLINVTHHDGALEEYKKVWSPIVQDELERRQKEPFGDERAVVTAYADTHFDEGGSLVVEMTVANTDAMFDLLKSVNDTSE